MCVRNVDRWRKCVRASKATATAARVIIGQKTGLRVCASSYAATPTATPTPLPPSLRPSSPFPLPPLSLLPCVLLAELMELFPTLLPFEVIIVGGNFESVNVRPDCWQQRQDGNRCRNSSPLDLRVSGARSLFGSGWHRPRPELFRAPTQRVFRSFKRILFRFPSAQNFPQARRENRTHQRPQRK